MTAVVELEGPARRRGRSLQVGLMAACLTLFLGGLVGLVAVGDALPTTGRPPPTPS